MVHIDVTQAETIPPRKRTMSFTWPAITLICIDHPVHIPGYCSIAQRDCMQSEHEQMTGTEQSLRTHLRPPYRYIGVTANHRMPADIAVILSGESRR